ncbi:amino acid adenylation domain-containing protein [Pseudoflavonifractor capillosus]|uniref:amino acid adenylation domain-containing protein n=1 Tax=Pseudoflavonifractor capillosus TaxID=106588 RepID=UPI00195A05B0|nr:amino acid adenylation domain-containing protein [Pseudoflavonifractor capillosus]MBM6694650.1 amino acid adenylation domain-containing protein [Pseudoflavonifractor capillosus]
MTNILEYLERSAQLFPEKPALVDERQSITFAQALEDSRRVGSSLALSLAKGQPVAVYMEKSVENLCAFWGIVYAGGFYVSFNTQLPTSRLQQMQAVLQAPFVITDEEHRAALEEVFPPHRILLYQDLVKSAVDRALLAQIRQRHVDTAPLYANFTSGSTGVPKAVVVGHRSTLDFIDHFCPIFSITQKDVIANQAPFDFDVSVKDIYSALATGATLVLVPRPLFSQPQQLLDFLCEHRATTLIWAVSALCLITTVHGLDYRTPETVNKVLFSGEVMPAKHLKIWMEHLPRAQFVNLYGPTEITCNCTYHIIDRERSYPDGIPMGQAFPNEDVFLLDGDDQLVTSPNVVGEVCVRGSALALGYYRNPDQTAAAFPNNPLNPCYPERIYRTGDLARYSTLGELHFCGRKDFQIKHMGHRIELEEIERAVSNLPGVHRCCCVFHSEKHRLYAFYQGELTSKELRLQLLPTLPPYMIPNVFRQVDQFPLNKNGKIDRTLLMKGAGSRG